MNKDELISIIKNELSDNSKATNLEIAKKLNIPVNIVKLLRRIISIDQKENDSSARADESKTDEQSPRDINN